jgi:hypothetical protein
MWWSPNHEDGRSQIAYSQIQEDLVGCRTFDLCIYASRGMSSKTNSSNNDFMNLCRMCCYCFCCSSPLWPHREIDLARPRELASVPLDTWSKLVTRIKEQRNCKFLGQRWIRILLWILYFVVIIYSTTEMVFFFFYIDTVELIMLCIDWISFAFLLVTACIVSNHLEQKHLDEIFLPSVRSVLSEVNNPLAVSGYEAKLIRAANNQQSTTNATGFFPFQPEIWLLRFTVLPNDEERRIAKAINNTTTTMPFAVPSATADPAHLNVEMVGV